MAAAAIPEALTAISPLDPAPLAIAAPELSSSSAKSVVDAGPSTAASSTTPATASTNTPQSFYLSRGTQFSTNQPAVQSSSTQTSSLSSAFPISNGLAHASANLGGIRSLWSSTENGFSLGRQSSEKVTQSSGLNPLNLLMGPRISLNPTLNFGGANRQQQSIKTGSQ